MQWIHTKIPYERLKVVHTGIWPKYEKDLKFSIDLQMLGKEESLKIYLYESIAICAGKFGCYVDYEKAFVQHRKLIDIFWEHVSRQNGRQSC